MLYVGNPHAPVVLALSLIFLGVHEKGEGNVIVGDSKIFWGVLLSLFSKPVVLLLVPALLFVKETRGSAVRSLLVYALVSLLMVAVPLVNPAGISWAERVRILLDPHYVKEHLNIYKNHFVLNAPMKDAVIHWLNLVAQSDYKLMNVEIFSFPIFVETLLPNVLPSWSFKLFLCLPLILLPFLPPCGERGRIEGLLGVLLTLSLGFFLSYNTVWEYQFTSVLPVTAMILLLFGSAIGARRKLLAIASVASLFIMLPSPYVIVRELPLGPSELTLIRSTRVLPVLVMYCSLLVHAILWVVTGRRLMCTERAKEGRMIHASDPLLGPV